jgi:hypothetical protein
VDHLGIASLAGALRSAGHEAFILDGKSPWAGTGGHAALTTCHGTDMMGFAVNYCNVRETVALADKVSRSPPHATIVAGGHYAGFHQELLLAEDTPFHVAVVGEGEEPLKALADAGTATSGTRSALWTRWNTWSGHGGQHGPVVGLAKEILRRRLQVHLEMCCFLGIEFFDKRPLAEFGKGCTPEVNMRAIRILEEYCVRSILGVILFHPADTVEQLRYDNAILSEICYGKAQMLFLLKKYKGTQVCWKDVLKKSD